MAATISPKMGDLLKELEGLINERNRILQEVGLEPGKHKPKWMLDRNGSTAPHVTSETGEAPKSERPHP